MPTPRFETPSGLINGLNTVFGLSVPYSPGTTAVFRNGILQDKTLLDGWYETDPSLGIITMKEPPSDFGYSDVIQVFFLDQSPSLSASDMRCAQLKGRLTSLSDGLIRAVIVSNDTIKVKIGCSQ
jgi:hypothetical protein